MKAVLDDQFPEVQQQLCIHHINSNVLLKAKKKWLKGRNSVSPDSSDDAEASISQTQAELSPKDRQFIHAPAAEAIPPGGALSSVVSSSGAAQIDNLVLSKAKTYARQRLRRGGKKCSLIRCVNSRSEPLCHRAIPFGWLLFPCNRRLHLCSPT